MIQRLLILCLACLPVLTTAQPINSWPTENAWWEIRYYDDFGNPTILSRVRHVDGDTLIQGTTYQKIWQSANYLGATRSDSLGRVYAVLEDSIAEHLLYDFSAQPGDTIFDALMGAFGQVMGTTALVVQYKDTVMLMDGPHLSLQVSDTAYSFIWTEVIDGVGTLNDFLYPMYWPSVSGWDQLVCMNRDSMQVIVGQCLVLGAQEYLDMKLDVYPNPTFDRVRIDFASPELVERVKLYDARGALTRRWDALPTEIDLSALPSGLYLLKVSGGEMEKVSRILRY